MRRREAEKGGRLALLRHAKDSSPSRAIGLNVSPAELEGTQEYTRHMKVIESIFGYWLYPACLPECPLADRVSQTNPNYNCSSPM